MTTITRAIRTSGGAPGTERARRIRLGGSRTPAAYLWMLWPAVALFAFFHTLPVIVGVFYSFTDYAGYGPWEFIGVGNYVNLFRDERVLQTYGFSFLFAIVATILTNVISLAIALGLNAKIKARNFWRGTYFVPYVLPTLVIGYVFQFFFSKSLPKLLSGIPVFADNILTSPDWAWTAIVALGVWQACAFAIIIYLSGLQTIPGELYEAASLDGAGAWQQFRSITLPLISAFFTINVVLSVKGFLQVFDQIMALTKGGPGTSTQSVTMLIFNGGISGGEFAYQTANAVIFFIVITVVSLVQLKFLQSREADM